MDNANQQSEIETLREELQHERFIAEYQRAGGALTEPDPLTGKTKQSQVYELAKPFLEKGQSLSEVVSNLSESPHYQNYFSDTPVALEPTGKTVSQKDFQAGKVPMEDIVSGKVRVKG